MSGEPQRREGANFTRGQGAERASTRRKQSATSTRTPRTGGRRRSPIVRTGRKWRTTAAANQTRGRGAKRRILPSENGPPDGAAIGAQRSGRGRLEEGSERMTKRTRKQRSRRKAGRPPTTGSKSPTTPDTAAPADGETTPGTSAGRRRRNGAGHTILERADHNASVIAVARNRDGFVTMRPELFVVNGRTGLYVNEIRVAPSRRGRGTGTRLLQEVTKAADATQHGLFVEPDEIGGTKLDALIVWYERHGFERAGNTIWHRPPTPQSGWVKTLRHALQRIRAVLPVTLRNRNSGNDEHTILEAIQRAVEGQSQQAQESTRRTSATPRA